MSTRTKAFVNFYAAMGTLDAYTRLNAEAKGMASLKDISVRFKVKDGPDGVLAFKAGNISVTPYADGVNADIGLYCSSCDKFNALVDGKGSSVLPFKGFFKLGFMLSKTSPFNVLSGKMGDLMRKKEFSSPEEKKLSTLLAFNAMVSALAVIANEDEIGKISAAHIPEGDIGIEIADVCALTLNVKKVDGVTKMSFVPSKSKSRARMVFDTIDTAKGLIDGKLDAMSCIGSGQIAMSGYIPMLHSLNNILNLVPKYLA